MSTTVVREANRIAGRGWGIRVNTVSTGMADRVFVQHGAHSEIVFRNPVFSRDAIGQRFGPTNLDSDQDNQNDDDYGGHNAER